MTITDSFLDEVAKTLNGESGNIPGYLAIGTTDVSSVSTEDTSLSGELSERYELTGSRTGNQIDFTATRSSTDVVDTTDGDPIESTGLHADETSSGSDPLLMGVVHSGITQTTNFDLEVVYSVTVKR